MSRLRVWIAFLLLSGNWGSSYLFIRIGVRQLTPLDLVGFRVAIGAIAVAVTCILLKQDLRVSRREFAVLFILATTNLTIPFLLIAWGEQTVPSGVASVLNSTVPIFSLLIAGAFLHDEPITLPKASGVVVGFVGVVLLLSRDLTHAGVNWSGVVAQSGLVLAAVFYAISYVLARHQLRGMSPLTTTSYVLAISAAQTLIPALVFNPVAVGTLRSETVLSVVWLGLLGSFLGYILMYYIIENWGAGRATLVTYMLPIVALSLGAMVLHERLDWRILAGSALVIAGVGLASLIRRSAGATDGPALVEGDAVMAAESRKIEGRRSAGRAEAIKHSPGE